MKLRNFYIKKIFSNFGILSILILDLFFINKVKPSQYTNSDNNFQDSPYLLGPGDVIKLTIIDHPELSGENRIINDGTITLPYSGQINLEGYTLKNAENTITELYKDQLISPNVQIKLIEQRPIKVSVVGEINYPGIYSLSNQEDFDIKGYTKPIKTKGAPTLVDAIQKAGGITQNSDITRVELIRNLPKTHDKKFKKTYINLLELIKNGNQNMNPIIFDGDIVKLDKSLRLQENIQNNFSNLRPETISVYVIGEVIKPGKIEVKFDSPLSQAIAAAGGINDSRGKVKNIKHIRLNRNGSINIDKIKLSYKDDSILNNPRLKDGDTIKVGRNYLTSISDSLSTISDPAKSIVNIYTLLRIID